MISCAENLRQGDVVYYGKTDIKIDILFVKDQLRYRCHDWTVGEHESIYILIADHWNIRKIVKSPL